MTARVLRGWVNPCEMQVPTFAGRVQIKLAAWRARVELAAGAGQVWVEKFFVWVNEC